MQKPCRGTSRATDSLFPGRMLPFASTQSGPDSSEESSDDDDDEDDDDDGDDGDDGDGEPSGGSPPERPPSPPVPPVVLPLDTRGTFLGPGLRTGTGTDLTPGAVTVMVWVAVPESSCEAKPSSMAVARRPALELEGAATDLRAVTISRSLKRSRAASALRLIKPDGPASSSAPWGAVMEKLSPVLLLLPGRGRFLEGGRAAAAPATTTGADDALPVKAVMKALGSAPAAVKAAVKTDVRAAVFAPAVVAAGRCLTTSVTSESSSESEKSSVSELSLSEKASLPSQRTRLARCLDRVRLPVRVSAI